VKTPRGSLLWTFSGAFLGVLVAGIVIQSVALNLVLRPALRAGRVAHREAIAERAARDLGRALESGELSDAQIVAILDSFAAGERGFGLVYQGEDGRRLASEEDGSPRRGAHPGRLGGAGHGPRRSQARASVVVRGHEQGEVIAVSTVPERLFWPQGMPRPGLLFLPIAAIIAAAAGLVLFRNVARRLGRLEASVRRVAAGELDTRVGEAGGDEIGRLGASFNAMAERLEESREQILEADRQRRRFLADVTHDLATPLTTIRGYAETLLDPNVPKTDEEKLGYVRFIHEEALRMDGLVTDLLDLARVESGAVRLDCERLDLAVLATAAVERARSAFVAAGLRIEGPSAGSAVTIDGDRSRIEQVFDNLLNNAIQHVPSGSTVRVRVASNGEALLIVEDDGPGFPAEDLPHVFERFYRGNHARPAGGTGLGLAIVRGIARAHGGDAQAENPTQGGARVVVRFPRTRETHSPSSA
jgi:signal transduction histidine kinase